MQDIDALFDALRHTADPGSVRVLEQFVRDGRDESLARINPLKLAADHAVAQDAMVAALLHGSRLGLFEMSWNILCRHCCGVVDVNTSLKTVRQEEYTCAFCQAATEPLLDNTVEVSFAVSPRVRRIAAHDPDSLSFWDYQRQIYFGSGVSFPEAPDFADLVARCTLETIELQPRERMIVAMTLGQSTVVIFDPVTHLSHMLDVAGEPTTERQELSLVFDEVHASIGRSTVRPGPLRLSLDNRTDRRVLPGAFLDNADLQALLGGRRPFLDAKRLLSNQTFRDIYRTDTLDVDQRLKILSLTFLFTDLKGSTELYERVGDLVAYDLVRAHFRILNEIVASESGAVVKTIGDAVMATFPSPHRAVSAALRMQDSMRRLNRERGAEDLLLKIGLHEGPCIAVSLNDRQDYFGQTVNIASRVQGIATADGIFATGSVVGNTASAEILTAHNIAAAPRTEMLRSIADRLPVFELTAG